MVLESRAFQGSAAILAALAGKMPTLLESSAFQGSAAILAALAGKMPALPGD